MPPNIKTVIITGQPGVGKTTLVKNVCEELRTLKKVNCVGFYTEELRGTTGERMGFDVLTLDGKKCKLAREKSMEDFNLPTIGKYAVYLNDFEELILPALINTPPNRKNYLLVVDEIGKMELLSKKFESMLINYIGERPILATMPLRTSQPIPIIEAYKNAPTTRIFHITRSNRNNVQGDIVKCILEMVAKP